MLSHRRHPARFAPLWAHLKSSTMPGDKDVEAEWHGEALSPRAARSLHGRGRLA